VLPKRAGTTAPALDTLSNPKLAAQNYFDLSVDYNFGETVDLYGGINNIFDKDPPIVGAGQGYANTWPATYDYAGMTVFMGFTVKTF
jgi:outer membrane receptor protein involved in Fe transport